MIENQEMNAFNVGDIIKMDEPNNIEGIQVSNDLAHDFLKVGLFVKKVVDAEGNESIAHLTTGDTIDDVYGITLLSDVRRVASDGTVAYKAGDIARIARLSTVLSTLPIFVIADGVSDEQVFNGSAKLYCQLDATENAGTLYATTTTPTQGYLALDMKRYRIRAEQQSKTKYLELGQIN